jgi:hypothetical protein
MNIMYLCVPEMSPDVVRLVPKLQSNNLVHRRQVVCDLSTDEVKSRLAVL